MLEGSKGFNKKSFYNVFVYRSVRDFFYAGQRKTIIPRSSQHFSGESLHTGAAGGICRSSNGDYGHRKGSHSGISTRHA